MKKTVLTIGQIKDLFMLKRAINEINKFFHQIVEYRSIQKSVEESFVEVQEAMVFDNLYTLFLTLEFFPSNT